jgi:hypothetical protein
VRDVFAASRHEKGQSWQRTELAKMQKELEEIMTREEEGRVEEEGETSTEVVEELEEENPEATSSDSDEETDEEDSNIASRVSRRRGRRQKGQGQME